VRSPAALAEIHDIARTSTSRAFATRAGDVFARVAAELGLAADDLADRLVPELTEADLTFGDARVGFSAELVPTLPTPPGDADDARRFADLAKLTKKVARAQHARLERAMAEATRMTYAHFSEVYLMHVLLRELARGVVWAAHTSATERALFRIAADGTPVDVLDQPFDLPLGATFGVAHPAELTAGELASWRLRFPEQRVDQLSRAVFPATDAPTAARRLAGFVGAPIRTGAILAAIRGRGWQRGRTAEGGRYVSIHRAGRHAERTWSCGVRFEPGVPFTRDPGDDTDDQTIVAVELRAEGDPPRAVLSELERDLRDLLVRAGSSSPP
jgi:hypothetical protein